MAGSAEIGHKPSVTRGLPTSILDLWPLSFCQRFALAQIPSRDRLYGSVNGATNADRKDRKMKHTLAALALGAAIILTGAAAIAAN